MVGLAIKAGRALLWLARNAPKDVISKFRILMKNNPKISGALTAASLYEAYDLVTAVMDSAEAEEASAELINMAQQAGVPDWVFDAAVAAVNTFSGNDRVTRDTAGTRQAASAIDTVLKAIPKTFLDGEPNTMSNLGAEDVLAMKTMHRFICSEISPNAAYVVKYHAMLREFLMMEPDDVKKMLESFA